jgi:hypothetical protein
MSLMRLKAILHQGMRGGFDAKSQKRKGYYAPLQSRTIFHWLEEGIAELEWAEKSEAEKKIRAERGWVSEPWHGSPRNEE